MNKDDFTPAGYYTETSLGGRAFGQASEILFVVGARLNSSRLPAKHLLNLCGAPVIERIFERLDACEISGLKLLATTSDAYNDPLAQWATDAGRTCYRYQGDVNDLVGRIDALYQHFRPRFLVYICGDCALLSPDCLDRGLRALMQEEGDAMGIASGPNGETVIHEGLQVYSAHGWQRLVAHSVSPLEREHVGLGAPEDFKRVTVTEPECYYRTSHRISLDTAADYRFLNAVYSLWYEGHNKNEIVDLPWVINQLISNETLANINSHVMQKSGFRHYGTVHLVCEASSKKGLGQLRRTINIAERLQEEMGLGTRILILGEQKEYDFLRFCHYDWFENEGDVLHALENAKCSLLVLDVFPQRQTEPERWVDVIARQRDRGCVVVGLDHCYRWQNVCDLIIIPSPERPKIENLTTPLEYGWHYIPTKVTQKRKFDIESAADSLLVLTGGSDALDYGVWLPEELDEQLPAGTKIIWVQGPYANAPNLPNTKKCQWSVIKNPLDMAEVIAQAGTALTVYGVTFFELIAARVPTILLPSGEAMSEKCLAEIKSAEVAEVFEEQSPVPKKTVLKELYRVRTLLSDKNRRSQLIANMEKLNVDAGLENIVASIAELLDEKSDNH